MAQYNNITEALSTQRTALSGYHRYPEDYASLERERLAVQLAHDKIIDQENDSHEIQHGLPNHKLRILFKIIAKDLPDCGRKRGAILRYIEAYDNPKPNTGKALYKKLTKS